ncbi:MAG: tetratricopeptide repeat protein [Flavobacteriaceae bacterium]
MRLNFIFFGLFLLGLGFYLGNAQTTEEWFEKGNAAYTNAAYKQAIEAYLKSLEEGQHSTALYYNLGSAYYRMNAVAESIYYFEKGLTLAPNDPDLKNNILFAKNMTVDAIEELPQTQVAQFQSRLLSALSLPHWTWLSLLLVWLFALFMTGYLWLQSSRVKKQLFVIGLIFGVLGVASYFAANAKNNKLQSEQYGIVFSERIEVNNEPNRRSEIQFTLHEGTKVQILEQFQEWQKIRIANGAEGWVSDANIRPL